MEHIKPLQNVTVLEVGTSLAEQLVGRHLQLLGARVITLPEGNYILTDGKEIFIFDDIMVRPKVIHRDSFGWKNTFPYCRSWFYDSE